jgi:hypothetical protein
MLIYESSRTRKSHACDAIPGAVLSRGRATFSVTGLHPLRRGRIGAVEGIEFPIIPINLLDIQIRRGRLSAVEEIEFPVTSYHSITERFRARG